MNGYTIGAATLLSSAVREIINSRRCGGVYLYNNASRNEALMINGVTKTKYSENPSTSTMVAGFNIGTPTDVYLNEGNLPYMTQFYDETLLSYTTNEELRKANPTVSNRLTEAFKWAQMPLSDSAVQSRVAMGESEDDLYVNETEFAQKYSDYYTVGETSTFTTTDGGNLKGRLEKVLRNFEIESGIPQLDTLRNTLRKYSSLRGGENNEIDLFSVDGTLSKMQTPFRYDDINNLNRLVKVYRDNPLGFFQNISKRDMEKMAESLRNAMGGAKPYVVTGSGNDIKGENYYSTDEDWSIYGGRSIDRESYSEGMGTNAQSVPSDSYSPIQGRVYELYNEDGRLKVGIPEDGHTSEGYVVDGLSDDEAYRALEPSVTRSSLLRKTNELFKSGKIGSLINRFHTKEVEMDELHTAVDSTYGMSRGRNLRKASEPTDHYGYDNPYCRVWTSVNQYSKYTDLIRPFTDGGKAMTPSRVRQFNGGLNARVENLDAFGSMLPVGLPRITPFTDEASVKRCMFSIENLAWRDINFNATVNSLEGRTVLSKEQQGPNGGRIMWFPPYNLKFSENVGVQWNANNFIGRGEQIYTYTNTERGGTLNFTLLIDHPSIVDRWGRLSEVSGDNERALLRYFAGCGDGDEALLQPAESLTPRTVVNETEETYTEKGEWIPIEPQLSPVFGDGEDRYYVFFPNDFSGIDYTKKGKDINTAMLYLLTGHSGAGYEMHTPSGVDGCIDVPVYKHKDKNGNMNNWHYQVDERCADEVLGAGNYVDTKSYLLNCNDKGSGVAKLREYATNSSVEGDLTRKMFGFDTFPIDSIYSFEDLSGLATKYPLENYDVEIFVKGYASSHGHKLSNTRLSDDRATAIAAYIKGFGLFPAENIHILDTKVIELSKGNKNVSSFEAKVARSVEVAVVYKGKNSTPTPDHSIEGSNIVYEERDGRNGYYKVETKTRKIRTEETIVPASQDSFDNEYLYFRKVEESNSLIKKNIVEKIQYFDPAFHSITPEGFNGRLSFLHQCTRQGPTSSASDRNGASKGAGNLAFGRPPICILRIGDFYNTKIIIDSISIDYDNGGGVQWDMNPEGIGLQPMMANIAISFKFLGGSDITGPIERLQNAVSSNFYANESIYNERSDYKDGDTTMTWSPTFTTHSNNNGEGTASSTQNNANHYPYKSK